MKRALLAALLLATTGCYHIKYINGATPPAAPKEEQWHHNYVLGFIEGDGVNLAKECPNGTWAAVEHQYSTVDALIQLVLRIPFINVVGTPVLWVWTPTHTRVTCGSQVVAAPPPVTSPPGSPPVAPPLVKP